MIGLHMLNDQIIGLSAFESIFNIVKPLVCKSGVHRIHYRYLFIYYGVGIIGYTVWHLILSFKKIDLVVVDADVFDIVSNCHKRSPPKFT